MIGLEELVNPITYSYVVQAPWGATRQVLTVEAPGLVDQPEAAKRLGWLLWGITTAPAVVGSVRMTHLTCTFWKSLAVPQLVTMPELRGNVIGTALPRDRTPQLVQMTGHLDDDGKRRWFLPGAPTGWATGDLLNTEGFERLIPHARGIMLGLASPGLGSGLELLLAYPGVLESTLENFTGTAFRRVTHMRVVHHLDRAPDFTGLPD